MASSKPKKKTPAKKTPAKKVSTSKRSPAKNNAKNKKRSSEQRAHFAPWIFGLVAAFLAVCLVSPSATGVLGKLIKDMLQGLFSGGAFAVPVILVAYAIFWKRDAEQAFIKYRVIISLVALLNQSAFWHAITGNLKCFDPKVLYTSGKALKGGGVIGGFLGSCIKVCIGTLGLYVLSILLLVIFGFMLFGVTPNAMAGRISEWLSLYKEKREERREPEVRYEDKPEPFFPDGYDEEAENGNIEYYDDEEDPASRIDGFYEDISDALPFEGEEETLTPINTEIGKKKFPDEEGLVDLTTLLDDDDIIPGEFADEEEGSDEISAQRSPAVEDPIEKSLSTDEDETEPEKPKYVFPPTSLLKYEKGNARRRDDPEQLKACAEKLVDTLRSFNVKTHLVNISRGPTITRYELAPEEGVRVRSIANLVDDISLSLATSGVRIEAPIPGKAAVGIEVPNTDVATVYLRELIENETFRNNKSRVAVGLGMDVAGKPIYLDISKMPHLLIAGATGMGKSVCINSMIVSLVYKASPDEVKLMLIDPKKVEFNIYNQLPHLIVPVVSDPKKAAGSLQWAVKEMERRFELIESAGVRDIFNYNNVTKDDPSYEFLPHIVIIIDELADLMMTAPDSVENSICRLAQKARAAGMHLIIGTQRPSVDVITGLIKANIPSRIAFTVSSQVDSRTIIDVAGAEKLIGRGDMLYAPVGCAKPMRVQGAFVGEQEVEKVMQYIVKHGGGTDYSEEVLENIEREAEHCVTKKVPGEVSGGGSADGEDDPMLEQAIELAVESGKISTSLIQRRLSLGYGRAAKLIDQMESKGIVGPPEGNKPRQVLISKESYMEMKVSSDE